MVTLAMPTEAYELAGEALESARSAVFRNALWDAAGGVDGNDPDEPTYNPGRFEWLTHVVATVEILGAPGDPIEPVTLSGLDLAITRRAALEAAAFVWDRDDAGTDAGKDAMVAAQRLLVALGWPAAA